MKTGDTVLAQTQLPGGEVTGELLWSITHISGDVVYVNSELFPGTPIKTMNGGIYTHQGERKILTGQMDARKLDPTDSDPEIYILSGIMPWPKPQTAASH